MEFSYKYHGSSAVKNSPRAVGISFVPDVYREPTFFTGQLRRHIPFREAVSALHNVVISDLRYLPKDRTDYKEWAAQQESVWLSELMADAAGMGKRMEEIRAELHGIRSQKNKILGPFHKARSEFFRHIYKHHSNIWMVLDPVITVHPDEVFFECFSKDESSYGKLGCTYDVFKNIGEFACGTTNIDYSEGLYNEFQKIRDYKKTDFCIDPKGFELQTAQDESFKESKIDLPESWVRGFLQVSSAMTLPARQFDLHPTDLYNFCFVLRRNKEKKGPRSIRYLLKPGEPVRAVFEPWNYEIICSRSIYTGSEAEEIRVWGRRRLRILERLIPLTERFRVFLLGTGLPSFYLADMNGINFTLGLSGWTANDWSRMGNFDLMAPRGETDGMTQQKIWLALKQSWLADADALAARVQMEKATVLSALSAFVQAGRAVFDLNKGVYRVRELSRIPLPADQLRFSNEREESATRFVQAGNVHVHCEQLADDTQKLSGTVTEKEKVFKSELLIDPDGRMVNASCSCYFFKQNRLHKGPCEHMLALRMAQNR